MSTIAANVLAIQEGACNPRAMARELVKAVDQACDNGGSPAAGKSPEVRLILHQLLWVLYGVDLGCHDLPPLTCGCPILREGKDGEAWNWDKDMATVRERVEAERLVRENATHSAALVNGPNGTA